MKKKKRNLKFVWSSNGHWTNSGYGVQTRDVLFRLRDDGWPLGEIAFFGLQGYKTKIDDILVYPTMNDVYGTDALYNHAIEHKAQVAFTMQDIWTLDVNILKKMISTGVKWIPYLPIDQDPVSPLIIERLKLAHKIVTFSRFGKKTLQKYGFASRLILEGTDTNIFKPMEQSEVRKQFGLDPDAFIFGMVAANKENPPRKGYQEILEAMEMFVKNHPRSILFIHSQQVAPTGFPIRDYANYLGIGKNVLLLDQYTASFRSTSEAIAKEINMFDVTMHASQTEGFGLGIIESQACGVPVIVNNCHSMPELVVPGETGEICDTGYKWWRNQNGYVYTADVNSLHDKMETLYKKLQDPKKKKKIAKAARENVLTNYDITNIVNNNWISFLEELQEELTNKDKNQ